MSLSYNKLWKLLIDKGTNKTKLREATHMSSSTMAKLGNNRNALPFTVTFDASGRPRHLRLGAIDEAEAERLIGQLTQP